MDDVARAAKVSKPTVSRALSGHPNVTDKTREHILEVARKLEYAVNRNAKKLREKYTNTAAVILDFKSHKRQRISDPFIFELLAGVSEALSIRGQDLLLSPPNLNGAESYHDLVRSRVVDGFIFLGQGDNEDILTELANRDVPIIVWGGQNPNNGYCTVGSDNYLGGVLAGERFIEFQRSKILFVGNSDHLEIRLRRDGLISSLNKADYKLNVEDVKSAGFSFNDSYTAIGDHIQKNGYPDAIFAYSDTAGMAAIKVMNEGAKMPIRDYSLVGYNDIVQSSHYSPPLTTIRQDTFLAGSLLVEKYTSLVEGNQPVSSTIPTEIIVRKT